MIVLDTSVIAACMRPAGNRAVISWLNAQVPEEIWTTAISLFELRHGVHAMTAGERNVHLEGAWHKIAEEIFQSRILAFDAAAAQAAAALNAECNRQCRKATVRNTFIAGICLSRRARLATRNFHDFADAGLVLINPWEEGGC